LRADVPVRVASRSLARLCRAARRLACARRTTLCALDAGPARRRGGGARRGSTLPLRRQCHALALSGGKLGMAAAALPARAASARLGGARGRARTSCQSSDGTPAGHEVVFDPVIRERSIGGALVG